MVESIALLTKTGNFNEERYTQILWNVILVLLFCALIEMLWEKNVVKKIKLNDLLAFSVLLKVMRYFWPFHIVLSIKCKLWNCSHLYTWHLISQIMQNMHLVNEWYIIKITTNRLKLLSPHRLPKFSRKSQQYRLGSRTRAASSVRGSRLIQLIQSGNCFPSILALPKSSYLTVYTCIYCRPLFLDFLTHPFLSVLSQVTVA